EDPVDLNAALDSAIDTVLPDASEKNVTFHRKGPRGPVVLRGDATKLQQVFWNLLANAVKFTHTGGRIETSVEQGQYDVHLSVSDTGQGIKPDLLPRIFEQFKQGDSSISRRHGGLGLGLTIAKCIVDMHGGTIEARSDGDGRGACFTVTLPLIDV